MSNLTERSVQAGWSVRSFLLISVCLLLAGCGTFEIQFQILPDMTRTAQAALHEASPSATVLPEATSSPVATTTAAVAVPTRVVLQTGQAITLTAIQMTDSGHGWAVEPSGYLLKTGDGGRTWMNVTPFQATFDPQGLYAFNADAAWVVPARLDVSNVVWRTQDGGNTWEASQPIPLGNGGYHVLNLQFPDAGHGWLLLLADDSSQGGRVLAYQTVDGGLDWEAVKGLNQPDAQAYLPDTNTGMAFFDEQTGWLGGWWGSEQPNQWLVLKTVDGGASWKTDSLPLPGQGTYTCNARPIRDMAPGSMALEVTCLQADSHRLYYLSANGPASWRSWKLPGGFLDVDFINASSGWMLVSPPSNSLNQILRTEDGGRNWIPINLVAWQTARFDFVSPDIGWAIVGDGRGLALVHSINGGVTWDVIKPLLAGQ